MNEKSKKQDPSLPKDFRAGTFSFSEWNGLWKCLPEDDEVGRDEYELVSSELDFFCRQTYRDSPQFVKDFYIRGDYTGDRTQVLEVNNPDILDLKLLQEIQGWLSNSKRKNWRIIVPTYLAEDEVIVIYPSVIRISAKYETSLPDGIKSIASKMRRF